MKTFVIFICVYVLFYQLNYSQQYDFSFIEEGTSLKYISYNEKGDQLSFGIHKTVSVIKHKDSIVTKMQATQVSKEKKYKTNSPINYTIVYNQNETRIGPERFFLTSYDGGNMNVEINGNTINFPRNKKFKLNDGQVKVKIIDNTIVFAIINYTIFNRKNLGKEKITTPAGTFLCKKISYDIEESYFKGAIKTKSNSIEWYSDELILIKSEFYNNIGMLERSHELVSKQ